MSQLPGNKLWLICPLGEEKASHEGIRKGSFLKFPPTADHWTIVEDHKYNDLIKSMAEARQAKEDAKAQEEAEKEVEVKEDKATVPLKVQLLSLVKESQQELLILSQDHSEISLPSLWPSWKTLQVSLLG